MKPRRGRGVGCEVVPHASMKQAIETSAETLQRREVHIMNVTFEHVPFGMIPAQGLAGQGMLRFPPPF